MIELKTTTTSDPPEDQAEESVEFQRGISDDFRSEVGTASSTAKSRKLYCFSCHRSEHHANAIRSKSFYNLLFGLTFGMIWLIGPFRCRCCGHRRLGRMNFLNPRYHFHRWKYSAKAARKPNKSSQTKPSSKQSNRIKKLQVGGVNGKDEIVELIDESENGAPKKRKLKSVPQIQSIGQDRKQRLHLEEQTNSQAFVIEYSIEGVLNSFETKQSRQEKLDRLARSRAKRDFIAKKLHSHKSTGGKRRRRYAKKQKLSGPRVYCFGCKQKQEHYHNFKGKSYYPFLLGVTFGLAILIGPFRCSCCSKNRLSGIDMLNPRYLFRRYLEKFAGYGG